MTLRQEAVSPEWFPLPVQPHELAAVGDFYQTLDRLEFDHQPIEVGKPGQQVGVHVSHRVREGDVVKRIV